MKKILQRVAGTSFALALSACGNSADEDQSVRPSIEEETRSVESSGGEDEDTLAEVPEDISEDGQKASTDEGIDNSRETGGEKMQEMTVEVSGQKFQASLYDNETVHAFLERLPMTLDMEELNGNEKFYYLDVDCPPTLKLWEILRPGILCCLVPTALFCSSRISALHTIIPVLVISKKKRRLSRHCREELWK